MDGGVADATCPAFANQFGRVLPESGHPPLDGPRWGPANRVGTKSRPAGRLHLKSRSLASSRRTTDPTIARTKVRVLRAIRGSVRGGQESGCKALPEGARRKGFEPLLGGVDPPGTPLHPSQPGVE